MAIDIQAVTSLTSGFFNKPVRADLVGAPFRVILFGGGGGGGGGTSAVAATAVSGGSGGGGGARIEFTTVWDYIGVREKFTIGAGGTGGAGNAVGLSGGSTSIGGSTYTMLNMPPVTGG